MGTQLPSPKRGIAPEFLAHVYCGQTAGWMNTPLGTEVDLGRGHFVLDGFQAIGERGTTDPSFRPMPIVATVAHLSYCSALVEAVQGIAAATVLSSTAFHMLMVRWVKNISSNQY